MLELPGSLRPVSTFPFVGRSAELERLRTLMPGSADDGQWILLLGGEKVFHAYRESGALGTALVEAWEHRDRNVIFAKAICVGVAFAGYHLFVATDGRLGEGTLWRAIWGKR